MLTSVLFGVAGAVLTMCLLRAGVECVIRKLSMRVLIDGLVIVNSCAQWLVMAYVNYGE